MKHDSSCLIYLCFCPVSEDCPVCRPAARGVLCATHRSQANTFAYLMDESAPQCSECGDDGSNCSECCPHDETDHGVCCDCETDLAESMMAAAYNRAKDAQKYGA